MAAVLNATWWKKNKAKTLLNEPLTKALEALDKARTTMDGSPSRENLAALTGATRTAEGAITQTVSKCNAKLHKDTIAHLKELDAQAKHAYGALQTTQKNFATLLADYQKHRDVVADILDKAVKGPQTGSIDLADKAVKAMMGWLDTHKDELSSKEVMLTSQWLAKVQPALTDAVKFVNQQPVNPDLPKVMAEIKTQIPRIIAPGGTEMPKGWAISDKPFGQGL